jgi:hypothetical protein
LLEMDLGEDEGYVSLSDKLELSSVMLESIKGLRRRLEREFKKVSRRDCKIDNLGISTSSSRKTVYVSVKKLFEMLLSEKLILNKHWLLSAFG